MKGEEKKIVGIHIYCINKLICVFVKTFSVHLKSTNTKLIQKFITFHYFHDTFCPLWMDSSLRSSICRAMLTHVGMWLAVSPAHVLRLTLSHPLDCVCDFGRHSVALFWN